MNLVGKKSYTMIFGVMKMANDRVSRETAELIPLPPHTWYVRTVGWLLEQEKVQENIKNVPANEPLKEALKNEGIRSPFLCMPNWYPIAGSQRLRVLADITRVARTRSKSL